MNVITGSHEYKKRSLLIKAMGIILLLGGIAVGFLGPLEMYCFYEFSEGGRFHYEGFGFGSFMFGNIASQAVGYYLTAAILIPLGYGHLRMRKWVRNLTLAVLRFWLVVGAPVIVVAFFILAGTKEMSIPAILAVLIVLALSYPIIPVILVKLYNSKIITETFKSQDKNSYQIEKFPVNILVICLLFIFYIIAMHILIMFNGIFPVFGFFIFGLQGIILIDILIFCFTLLAWGTIRRRIWAWWSSVIIVGIFTFSTIVTFIKSEYLDILSGLKFPLKEIEFLDGIPAQGYHFAILVGVPLFITWILVVLSKRYYKT